VIAAFVLDVFLRVSLTPAIAFAPVTLEAYISVREGRVVRAEMDCDNGYYSSSTWDREDKPHRVTYKQTSGGTCTLTVIVVDHMGKVIGSRSAKATVIGRES